MEILGQRWEPWAGERLGTPGSRVTISQSGCAITALAMEAGLTPSEVNQLFIEHRVYANTNEVDWTRVQQAIPWLSFVERSDTYDNAKVLQAIADYGCCIVKVDFDGNPDTIDGHFVLFTGNRRLYDPWTGTERATSVYPRLLGYRIFQILPRETPMSERESRVLAAIGDPNNFFLDGDPIVPGQLMTITRAELDGFITASAERDQLQVSLKAQEAARIHAENAAKTAGEKLADSQTQLQTSRAAESEAVGKLSVTQKQVETLTRAAEVAAMNYKNLQDKYQTDMANEGEKLDAAIKGSQAQKVEYEAKLEAQENSTQVSLAQKDEEISKLRQTILSGLTLGDLVTAVLNKIFHREAK